MRNSRTWEKKFHPAKVHQNKPNTNNTYLGYWRWILILILLIGCLSCVEFTGKPGQLVPSLHLEKVFRIHDILVWIRIRIRIRGSMPLTSGSGCGSGSFCFHHWPSRCQQKDNLKKVFLYIRHFLVYFYIIFKDKKSKRCHKTVEIKVFLTIFA